MKNKWLQIGCFLTGYNYDILMGCSEVPRKDVKRYTSALIIISIIWFFVGFSFSSRYLGANILQSFFTAIVSVIIIIQVERQIILSVHQNKQLYRVRTGIAITMALIGSLIIDQIIFKADIDQEKILVLKDKVDKVYPGRSEEIKSQINELDSTIIIKENIQAKLRAEVIKNPTIIVVNSESKPIAINSIKKDENGNDISVTQVENYKSVQRSNIANPSILELAKLDTVLNKLRISKSIKEESLLKLRPAVELEIQSHIGFIDELNVMISILLNSPVGFVVWVIWFLFFLGLELFILYSKKNEVESDYHALIKHQEQLHRKKIELMSKSNT